LFQLLRCSCWVYGKGETIIQGRKRIIISCTYTAAVFFLSFFPTLQIR